MGWNNPNYCTHLFSAIYGGWYITPFLTIGLLSPPGIALQYNPWSLGFLFSGSQLVTIQTRHVVAFL